MPLPPSFSFILVNFSVAYAALYRAITRYYNVLNNAHKYNRFVSLLPKTSDSYLSRVVKLLLVAR